MPKGKIAIVTGASSGNGRGIAKRYVEKGAKVIVADLNVEAREGSIATADMINESHPGMARFVKCNVSQISELEALVAEAEDWGGLDIMINNAGILLKQPILEVTEDVCLKTVPGFCAIGEPLSGTSYMPESGGGRIERMEVPGIVRKLDRPRLSHVLN